VYCVVKVVHSHKHTYMSSSYSSLDWVLSHWAHFTVPRFLFMYFLHCIVLLHMCCIIVMLMTDAQETCTRNLRKLTCARNLYVCHADLQQDFTRASFSHQIEPVLFYARNLQSRDSIYAHWLDTRGGRKPPASVDASFLYEKLASKIWCKFLVRVFGASFLYKFLVRLSSA